LSELWFVLEVLPTTVILGSSYQITTPASWFFAFRVLLTPSTVPLKNPSESLQYSPSALVISLSTTYTALLKFLLSVPILFKLAVRHGEIPSSLTLSPSSYL